MIQVGREEIEEKKLSAVPNASGWSELMDHQLMEARLERGLPWKAVNIIAPDGRRMTAKRCQDRLKLLTSEADRPALRVSEKPAPAEDRDGIEWLARKGRLTPRQRAAAEYARRVIRAAETADGASLKSCLDVSVGGGASGLTLRPAEASASAKRELFTMRWLWLGGQSDLLTVVDGVCGKGQTLRQLAGEEGADSSKIMRRATVLEAVLKVALDLIARHLDEPG